MPSSTNITMRLATEHHHGSFSDFDKQRLGMTVAINRAHEIYDAEVAEHTRHQALLKDLSLAFQNEQMDRKAGDDEGVSSDKAVLRERLLAALKQAKAHLDLVLENACKLRESLVKKRDSLEKEEKTLTKKKAQLKEEIGKAEQDIKHEVKAANTKAFDKFMALDKHHHHLQLAKQEYIAINKHVSEDHIEEVAGHVGKAFALRPEPSNRRVLEEELEKQYEEEYLRALQQLRQAERAEYNAHRAVARGLLGRTLGLNDVAERTIDTFAELLSFIMGSETREIRSSLCRLNSEYVRGEKRHGLVTEALKSVNSKIYQIDMQTESLQNFYRGTPSMVPQPQSGTCRSAAAEEEEAYYSKNSMSSPFALPTLTIKAG